VENYPVAEKYFLEFMEDLELNLGPQHAYTIEIRGELARFWDLKMGMSEKANDYRLKHDLQP